MKKIELKGETGKGKFTLIDGEDFGEINSYKWYLSNKGYAYRVPSKSTSKKPDIRSHLLHRFLFKEIKKGLVVDHINGNPLDNRKTNLRVVTQQQNSFNRRTFSKNTSGFPGVDYDNRRKKWRAQIKVNYKSMFLGYFIDKNNAIKARKFAVLKYFGEFAPK